MKNLIKEYTESCEKVYERLFELTQQMNELKKNGGDKEISDKNLEQRIGLLYTEHRQTKEIIAYLTAYSRRVEQRVKTNNIL